jgi:hypothetical protein
LTIDEVLNGAEVKMPQQAQVTFKQAQKANCADVEQQRLDLQARPETRFLEDIETRFL